LRYWSAHRRYTHQFPVCVLKSYAELPAIKPRVMSVMRCKKLTSVSHVDWAQSKRTPRRHRSVQPVLIAQPPPGAPDDKQPTEQHAEHNPHNDSPPA